MDEEMAENPENLVANYKRPRNPYKVAFTGIYGVGKTSLFRSIFNQPPSHVSKCTHEEIFDKDETVIPLEFWDTADMERHGSVTRSYYRGSKFVLLVYSATDEESLHRLRGIAKYVKEDEPAAKLILVRNKTDLPIGDESVSEEKERDFLRSEKKKIFATSFRTSAKTGDGIENLIKELGKQSLKMFKSKGRWGNDQNENGFELDTKEIRQENKGCCSG